MNTVEYGSNNSGGRWWLTDANWKALEKAGWQVKWHAQDTDLRGDRWLGSLASYATRTGLTLRDAILEWEKITGLAANDLGCACCGPPHTFTVYDEDETCVASYSPQHPTQGERDF